MKITHASAALALTLMAGVASAGYIQPQPVQIDSNLRTAIGDMSSARSSEDPNELIGCGIRQIEVGVDVFVFGFCSAAVGEASITCLTVNPDLIRAIDAISDYSFITFSWNDQDECTRIGVSTQSFYLPLLKTK